MWKGRGSGSSSTPKICRFSFLSFSLYFLFLYIEKSRPSGRGSFHVGLIDDRILIACLDLGEGKMGWDGREVKKGGGERCLICDIVVFRLMGEWVR